MMHILAHNALDARAKDSFRDQGIVPVAKVYSPADAQAILTQTGQIKYFTAERESIDPCVSVAKLKAGSIIKGSTLGWLLEKIADQGQQLGLDLAHETFPVVRDGQPSGATVKRSRVEAYHIPAERDFRYQLGGRCVAAVASLQGEMWLTDLESRNSCFLRLGDVAFTDRSHYALTATVSSTGSTALLVGGEHLREPALQPADAPIAA